MASCVENESSRRLETKADLLQFAQKIKSRFAGVIENEIKTLKSIKTQFALNVKVSRTRNGEKQEMEYYFKQREPTVFNRNNAATVDSIFRRSFDEFKDEIEAWSQRGSGWLVQAILETFINVARYQPFLRGSYMLLPKKLCNKKVFINIQNRDNQCLRWARVCQGGQDTSQKTGWIFQEQNSQCPYHR